MRNADFLTKCNFISVNVCFIRRNDVKCGVSCSSLCYLQTGPRSRISAFSSGTNGAEQNGQVVLRLESSDDQPAMISSSYTRELQLRHSEQLDICTWHRDKRKHTHRDGFTSAWWPSDHRRVSFISIALYSMVCLDTRFWLAGRLALKLFNAQVVSSFIFDAHTSFAHT